MPSPLLDAAMTARRALVVIAEADEHLVEDHVVEDFDALGPTRAASAMRSARAQQRSTRSRTPSGPATAARHTGRSPRTARRVEDPLPVLAVRVAAMRYERRRRHRGTVRVGIADRHEAAVVADVQPLVRVGRPRVGALEPATRCRSRGNCRPQPERAVDVHPGIRVRSPRRRSAPRVEGAGVHVAGLGADDASGGRRP